MARRPSGLAGAIILVTLGLGAGAGLIGWAIGHETKPSRAAPVAASTAPPGHSGAGLPAHEFGNPAKGAKLFVSKGCADCHSYAGAGGTDAPPLDYMSGHLSAREIANMSGAIWDHVPAMLPHFQEEGIPFPTFTGFEMADLIAYLHSKRPPARPSGGGAEHGAMDMGPAKPGDPSRGKSVFSTLGCGTCHTLAAAGSKGTVGPNLDTALKGKNARFIEQSLVDPRAVVAEGYEGKEMPSFKETLTRQQLADLVVFLVAR